MIKNETYYEQLNIAQIDISKFRIGQKGAFNCIIEKVRGGRKTISVVLPTRYGKSNVIRTSALELIQSKEVSGCLFAAPCKFLRDQLVSEEKIADMCKLCNIKFPIKYDRLDQFRLPLFPNNEDFIGICTQMLSNKSKQIANYVRQHIVKTGKKFLVYIDESHSASDNNKWGSSVIDITNAGGIVILLTATPFRDDNKPIPGFLCEETDKEECTIIEVKKTDGEYQKSSFEGIKSKVKLIPDYNFSFQRTWQEGGVICKVNPYVIDIYIDITLDDGIRHTKISDMTLGEGTQYLSQVTWHAKVIEDGIKHLIDKLLIRKQTFPKTQAIIFCGNDKPDEEDNAHAKRIQQEIACQNSNLEVIIATSKSETDADNLISSFAKGKGDILIVKQMASLGLDIANIKVALDLSSVRTLSAFIQRMMRAGTIQDKITYFDFIYPADMRAQKLYDNFVIGNGGELTFTIKGDLIETTTINIESDLQKKYAFNVPKTELLYVTDVNDRKDNQANDYEEYCKPLLKRFPQLIASLDNATLIEVAKVIDKDKLSDTNNIPKIRNITEEREIGRAQVNKFANIIKRKRGGNKEEQTLHFRKAIYSAKQAAGILGNPPLNKIVDIEKLTRMVNFLKKEAE